MKRTRNGNQEWLADQFEANRRHLRAVALRMLGSDAEAEDAVQESWLRLSRADIANVDNLGGWLTIVIARVCLDMLRSRKLRRELSFEAESPESSMDDWNDPERNLQLADSVGPALLVVLDTLPPAERVSFVLHDVFDLPFEKIAPIVGRSVAAARQLASRARRRVRGTASSPSRDIPRQRRVAEAYLAAARRGDFDALLEILHSDVVLRTNRVPEVRGAPLVARRSLAFPDRARTARLALVNGSVGALIEAGGSSIVLRFEMTGEKISAVEVVSDSVALAVLDVQALEEPAS